ncbi:MAG: hypothetical protein HY694_00300 [Deltaproteobacteria bacterium]|nr:hypothetical protein [Deltaproteobacteria bacterium]
MRFIIEVDKEWLDALEHLIELVLKQPTCSPEEALERAIFEQIEKQRIEGA